MDEQWEERGTACYIEPAVAPLNPSIPARSEAAPSDLERAESADGVDLTLIRWMLGLAPLERLAYLQDWVDGLAQLRNGRIAER
jgi:hypothetical protein